MARAHGSSWTPHPCRRLPGALDLIRAGVETDGAAHNRRFVAPSLETGPGVAAEFVTLAHDPQTNGGLLAAAPPRDIEALERALDTAGVPIGGSAMWSRIRRAGGPSALLDRRAGHGVRPATHGSAHARPWYRSLAPSSRVNVSTLPRD